MTDTDATPQAPAGPLARIDGLELDAVDPGAIGAFWAAVLDGTWEDADDGLGGWVLAGDRPPLRVRPAAGPKTVKHRAHLDVYARSVRSVTDLGATVLLEEGDDRRWTVVADPEGGELCVFVRQPVPEHRLHGLGIDSLDHQTQARWWAGVVGGRVVDSPRGFSTVEDAAGLTGMTMDFATVPEPRSGPNRLRWTLRAASLDPLLAAGMTELSPPDETGRAVLADREGNEVPVHLA